MGSSRCFGRCRVAGLLPEAPLALRVLREIGRRRLDRHPRPKMWLATIRQAALVPAKGSGLKALVPKGVAAQVAIVNPDGARSAAFTCTRQVQGSQARGSARGRPGAAGWRFDTP